MNGAQISHAIVHHPLSKEKVWGVKLCNYVDNDGKEYNSYSSGPFSFMFGRIPPGVDLRSAAEAYANSLGTWSNLWIYRMEDNPSGPIMKLNLNALTHGDYQPPPFLYHQRILARGGRLHDIYKPLPPTQPTNTSTAIVEVGANLP